MELKPKVVKYGHGCRVNKWATNATYVNGNFTAQVARMICEKMRESYDLMLSIKLPITDTACMSDEIEQTPHGHVYLIDDASYDPESDCKKFVKIRCGTTHDSESPRHWEIHCLGMVYTGINEPSIDTINDIATSIFVYFQLYSRTPIVISGSDDALKYPPVCLEEESGVYILKTYKDFILQQNTILPNDALQTIPLGFTIKAPVDEKYNWYAKILPCKETDPKLSITPMDLMLTTDIKPEISFWTNENNYLLPAGSPIAMMHFWKEVRTPTEPQKTYIILTRVKNE